MNKIDRNIILSAFCKVTYVSCELDEKIFDELSKYSRLAFNKVDFKIGSQLKIIFNPLAFDLVVEYSRMLDSISLDNFSINSKLWIINQKIKLYNYENDKTYSLQKNYAVYLTCTYNKFTYLGHLSRLFDFSLDSGHSQYIFNIFLGFEYYFK